MMRATRVLPAGEWKASPVDTVVLDYDARHRRRMAMTGTAGTAFVLDLSAAVPLRDGDGIALEDGRIVKVVAAPELLAEITAHSPPELLRFAWHLGNRHLPAQIEARRILIRQDHVIEQMVAHLGAHVRRLDAPFDPEGGAYGGHGHDHDHHDHGVHDHDTGALGHDDRIDDETGRG